MNLSFEEFRKLSKAFDRVTIYKEIDGKMDTPVSLLSRLSSFDNTILLESAKEDKTYSRFSFLAFDIKEKLILKAEGFYKNFKLVGDLSYLKDKLLKNSAPDLNEFGDFSGGYVGYLNFEFVEMCSILRKPLSKVNEILGVFYLIEKFCVYDNYTEKLYLALSRRIDSNVAIEEQYKSIKEELDKTESLIKGLVEPTVIPTNPVIVRDIPKNNFMSKVRKVKEMIEEGEAIQVVLSDYLEIDNLNPFEFYKSLRSINPSPYMYFLKDGNSYIAGSSPEVHIRIRNGIAILRPIAGTKPRGKTEDTQQIINVLTHDEKEKAEHLMLVDLARNDLSRVCKIGSVEVESFMQPEIYSHVIHLVSQVKGELMKGVNVIDAIKQTFPAGTVSGAPKTRAIEIIDELEEEKRGVYAGCIGYIGFNGNVDMAITIRTAIFTGSKARLQAGAGIVYDSIPEKEYEEIINKLKALIRSGGINDSIDR